MIVNGTDSNALLAAQVATEQRANQQNRVGLQQPQDRPSQQRDTVQPGGATQPESQQAVTAVGESQDTSIQAAQAEGRAQEAGGTGGSGSNGGNAPRGSFVNILT